MYAEIWSATSPLLSNKKQPMCIRYKNFELYSLMYIVKTLFQYFNIRYAKVQEITLYIGLTQMMR